MRWIKEHVLFVIILLLCATLRFIPLFEYQFTFDELSGLDRTQFNSFGDLIDKGVKVDAHPALIQILIYFSVKVFGYVTWIIKLPFLLMSLGAIIYAYLICLRNFSKEAGLIAVCLFSFSLIFIFYAPIARMYIPGVFFSLGLLYYFFEIFFLKKLSRINFLWLGVFALLSALNQHLNALFAFTLLLSGLFFINKQNFKPFLITCIATVLCYLPHLPVTLYQLSVPGIGRNAGGWLEAPELNVFFEFVKILCGTGKVFLVVAALLIITIVAERKFIPDKKQLLLFFLFVVNFLVIFFYSLWRSPIYQHSSMMFAAPALVLLISSVFTSARSLLFYPALVLLSIVLIYKSYIKKDYFNEAVKTVYEYQFERTVHYKKLLGDQKVYPLFFDCDTLMEKIYFQKYDTRFETKISSDSIISNGENRVFEIDGQNRSAINLFNSFVSKLDAEIIILSSSTPLYQKIVQSYFPYLVENTQTQGINFKAYTKKRDLFPVVPEDQVILISHPGKPGSFSFSSSLKQDFTLKVDSTTEFPFTAKGKLNEVVLKEGQVILSESEIAAEEEIADVESCISITSQSTGEMLSYAAKKTSDFIIKNQTTNLITEMFVGTVFNKNRTSAEVSCYIWNPAKSRFVIKDFQIKVIDYWPKKWQYWD